MQGGSTSGDVCVQRHTLGRAAGRLAAAAGGFGAISALEHLDDVRNHAGQREAVCGIAWDVVGAVVLCSARRLGRRCLADEALQGLDQHES